MNQLVTSYSSYHQENNLETSSTSKEQRPHLGPSLSLGAGANGCAEGDGIHLHLEQNGWATIFSPSHGIRERRVATCFYPIILIILRFLRFP
jgi:hypothetical protein